MLLIPSLSDLLRSLFSASRFCGSADGLRDVVGLFEPIGNRRFDLIAMDDPNVMRGFAFRGLKGMADQRVLQRAGEKEPDFQVLLLWPDKKVTDPSRKHDGVVGGVDSLRTEFHSSLPQPFPSVFQVFGQLTREVCFSSDPVHSREI